MKKKIFLLLLVFFSIEAVIPQKVVLCGVGRDVAVRVPYSMRIMEKIGALFDDYRVIVYENNSVDGTSRILENWRNNNHRVCAISECLEKADFEKLFVNRLENGDVYRPELIARARNIVLDVAMSEVYDEYDYLIWMDLDFKLEPDYEGIIEAFETDREWDAVFAYGIDPRGVYWDWYALRDSICPIGSELLGNYWWYSPKELSLTKSDDWYPVYSAFGGCGIYKKASIKGCRYSALATKDLAKFSRNIIDSDKSNSVIQKYLCDMKGAKKSILISQPSSSLADIHDPTVAIFLEGLPGSLMWKMSSFVYKYPSVCEHVAFHTSMIINGHDKLFINPRFLFRYGG